MSADILAQLTALEDELREQISASKAEDRATYQQYLKGRQPVCLRRYELVNGVKEPDAAELEGFHFAEHPGGDGEKEGDAKHGIPSFWANVLRNQDFISDCITERDQAALEYVQDIRLVQAAGEGGVEFHFGPNPFFSNTVLRRVVGWDDSEEGSVPVEEGTDIQWKEGQNLTIKESAKKSGKKGGKQRVKPCPSFFRFFFPAVVQSSFEEDEEGEGVDERALQKFDQDEAILKVIRDQVIPKAVHLYLSGSLKSAADESEEEYEVVSGQASPEGSLPLPAKKVFHALKKGQAELDALHDKNLSNLKRAHQNRIQKVKEMGIKRKDILVASDGSSLKAQGFYWHALRAVSLGPVALHGRDEKALAFLCDIRYDLALVGGDEEGFRETYEFDFLPNPYFSNEVLKREFEFKGSILSSNTARLVSSEITSIDWKPGMDLTVKISPTKSGSSQGSGKPAATFFGLFKKGSARFTFNIVGDSRDAGKEAEELEVEFFQQIRDEVVVSPAALYSEMDALEEEGSEFGSEASDPQEMEKQKAQLRGPAMQIRRGWTNSIRCTTTNTIIAVLALLVFAEVFMFWEQISEAMEG
ncbi:hypothetical protein BSKO_00793 [Bryopsis sp. KO-2023]|nr:hypothetical protein BSKO_00793 [Bryopsis sp. KO-2023]